MRRHILSFLAYGSPSLIRRTSASFVSYENVWFDPHILLSPRPQNVTSSLEAAGNTTLRWADETAQLGPWFVTSKTWAPSGATIQDFVSFAPYFWPDCTGISLTTNNASESIVSLSSVLLFLHLSQYGKNVHMFVETAR
ncbi:hypothetical protein DL96DRAFT_899988 [Flagelloscypha sp. PMI_526]|nr:hypothetical protein DL96DRAFT_899988 [Flagelloscypha sp. PMI_526]